MKKTLRKIAFVLVLAMLAGTVTGCSMSVAQERQFDRAVGGIIEDVVDILDALIETPRERQERELRAQERARENEQGAKEWNEKWSQYEEGIDTF